MDARERSSLSPGSGLRATGYGLRATGYGLRATGYGLRATGYGLQNGDRIGDGQV